jgi:hypothetical protein
MLVSREVDGYGRWENSYSKTSLGLIPKNKWSETIRPVTLFFSVMEAKAD